MLRLLKRKDVVSVLWRASNVKKFDLHDFTEKMFSLLLCFEWNYKSVGFMIKNFHYWKICSTTDLGLNQRIRHLLQFYNQVSNYFNMVCSTFSVLTRYIMYFHVCNNNTKRFPAFVYIWFRETTQHVEVVCSGKKEGGCYNQSHLSVNNVRREAFP